MLHTCHAIGCKYVVPPRMLFCNYHWLRTPLDLKKEIWRTYRPGQETDKRPSREYLDVQQDCVLAVRAQEITAEQAEDWVKKIRQLALQYKAPQEKVDRQIAVIRRFHPEQKQGTLL